jgi:hypothetical protein
MSLILVSRELKTEAEGPRRKISRLDTLEREMMKQYFVQMSLILCVSRELKTEAEGLRRKISRLDTLEREMMKIHEAYSALRKDEIPLLYNHIHVLLLKLGFYSW